MNLRHEPDEVLISKTEKLVREEREILTVILHRLKEINRRRLYSSMGYKSLFHCAVERFGYSEDQAYRRINAMKLIDDVPELEQKINEGALSLTHIGIAQTLFKQEAKLKTPLPLKIKQEVIEKMCGTSVRQAERIALSYSSAPLMTPDKIRAVSEDHIEIKLTVAKDVEAKLEKLKGFLAHQNPHLSLGELVEKLCDLGLQEWDPSKSAAPRKRRVKPHSKAQAKRQAYQKSQSACSHCGSHYALEVDHRTPRALGGSDKPKNLRVLCRSCNQRAAIEAFGQIKMDPFLRKRPRPHQRSRL